MKKYIGNRISFSALDGYTKVGLIQDWNEVGIVLEIKETHTESSYDVGEVIFINNSTLSTFRFI